MKYKELLNEYKKNTLPDKKMEEIAADIEKHEAISDYLYEESEIPNINKVFSETNIYPDDGSADLSQPEKNSRVANKNPLSYNDPAAADFTKAINRSIRRAFIKLGAVVSIIAVAALLFIQMVLPSIVDKFYYDPTKALFGEVTDSWVTTRMSKDISVYTELLTPETPRDYVEAESLGYGKYNISIPQSISYNNHFSTISGEIVRGKLRLYNQDILKQPAVNAFGWCQINVNGKTKDYLEKSLTELYTETDKDAQDNVLHGVAESKEKSITEIQTINDDKVRYAYITFEKMLNYDEVPQILDRDDLKYCIFSPWLAVDTHSDDSELSYYNAAHIGFFRQDIDISQNETDLNYADYEELLQQQHFTDLLDYISEQEEFLKMFEKDPKIFSDASAYIKENGMKIYGIGCIVNKEDMLKLIQLDEIREIYFKDIT